MLRESWIAVLILGVAAPPGQARGEPPIDFGRQIRPILEASCLDCHGPTRRRANLRLDVASAALKGGKSGPAIVPGKPGESLLVQRVRGEGDGDQMPKDADPLPADQIELLRLWIEQGAPWPEHPETLGTGADRGHWAYVKPFSPAIPSVQNETWCRNPVDRLVLARLERENISPSAEADRATLLRRVSLDLIGLPPTPAEVQDFVSDPVPEAFEKVVDRLLASPRYGERWARPWLDLARYADTNGYEKDLPRSLWPWRDWVIKALNDDMPFDRFSVLQLAGDLIPGATLDDRIATGFHRNTMLNDEGGIDPEEFRIVAVVDRVNTTATAWLGTTLACAQCHDHKYDPFTQKEYYQFFAFFNSTEDVGVGNGPEIEVPTDEQRRQADALRATIAELEKAAQPRPRDDEQARWESAAQKELESPAPGDGLKHHYTFDADTDDAVFDSGAEPRAGLLKPDAKDRHGPGRLGTAVRLDSGAFIECPGAADFDGTDAFSYGALVRFETSGCIIGRIDDTQAYRGFDLYNDNGKFQVHIVNSWPASGIKVQTKDTFTAGVWRHVSVTYDGSGKAAGVTVYVDGAPEPTDTFSDTLTGTIRSDIPLKLGSRHSGGHIDGLLDDARIYSRSLSAGEVYRLCLESCRTALSTAPAFRSSEQAMDVRVVYNAQSAARRTRRQLAQTREELTKLGIPTTMVMKELPAPRPTHILRRGNFRDPGEQVFPETPSIFPALPKFAPRNRLALGAWMVDENNPLVGRVAMNRAWEAFFGEGLVHTPEDFGAQGEMPTNPELLDFLATEFIRCGWSMKSMHRLIVTSATYRQSSKARPDLAERDPYNTLHARAPRFRLEAEAVRDNALAISGLLSDRIGGPSVMPPQPDGIWVGSFATHDTPNEKWTDATGPNRYRRGLYTYWRRSASYPASLTFDAPRRDVCVVRRSRTNTPLQALTTLNDTVYVEAALALGRRMMTEAAPDPAARIAHAVRLCLARAPTPEELERLTAFYDRTLNRYRADLTAARALAKQTALEVSTLDPAELGACALVANVLLNLDETLAKG